MSGMGETGSIEIQQLRELKGPLVDVRSPSEFEKGHWPGAINVPLFNDEERAAVGTAYKQQGRTPAIHLGLELTGPKLSSLARQLDNLRQQGEPRIYCWRGGMRSASLAWLAQQIDLKPRLLQGGYKSYRRWAQSRFEQIWPLRVMGGRTGTGKTDLLLAMAEALDQHQRRGASAIWLEAESIQVGRCRIPKALFDQMQEAPVLEIQRDLGERVNQLVQVYGHQGGAALAEATERISRRLGPQRTKEALEAIAREDWATACRATLDYYDRCYDHELARSPKRDTIDLSGLSADQAAETLIDGGFVEIPD